MNFDGINKEELLAKIKLLRKMIEKASENLSDDDAFSVPELFPQWHVGLNCEYHKRYRRNGLLYRCEQAHTAQEGWEPEITPALFTQVAEPGQIDVWKQPTGAQDGYEKGAKVHYPTMEDPIYISTYDGINVWAPGVYGWELFEG